MNDYRVTARTRLGRRPERGRYDRTSVHAILDEALVCHLGFVRDGWPRVITTSCWRNGERLYVHGSSASRALRALAGGIPVCVAVTLIDGLVLARSAFHHSVNYRSVVIYGIAGTVADDAEKYAALRAFMERLAPGRWDEVRPPDARELKATTVLCLALDEVSAKVRSGPPVDDAADLSRRCWAGVVPLALAAGSPEPDPALDPTIPIPAYALRPPFLGPVRDRIDD